MLRKKPLSKLIKNKNMKSKLINMKIHLSIALIVPLMFSSCSNDSNPETANSKLPVYGERYYDEETKDTAYHHIPDFELINQDSVIITEKDIEGKIFVADFFFTTCTTICPKMTNNLKFVAKSIKDMKDVYIVSHTVDPLIDTIETLRAYAKSNGINTKKWWFLTGDESFIHEHGGQGYLLNVTKDSTAQGGFLHSSIFVLVDKSKKIRGFYDGTIMQEVDKLIEDLKKLNAEYESEATAN
jgi:protein SCO1/2